MAARAGFLSFFVFWRFLVLAVGAVAHIGEEILTHRLRIALLAKKTNPRGYQAHDSQDFLGTASSETAVEGPIKTDWLWITDGE